MSKYFETLITISVLSVDEPYSFTSYEQLAYDIIEGEFSGLVVKDVHEELDRDSFDEKCNEHGSDITFFGVDDEEED